MQSYVSACDCCSPGKSSPTRKSPRRFPPNKQRSTSCSSSDEVGRDSKDAGKAGLQVEVDDDVEEYYEDDFEQSFRVEVTLLDA